MDASSVSRLADAYPMSFAAVQKHVVVLERAGLVTKRRRGREQLVEASPETLAEARRALDDLERSGVAGSSGCPSSSNPTDNTQRKEASMSVTTVEPDLDNLTLTVVADFEASVEEVWELGLTRRSSGAGGDRRSI